MPVPPIQGNEPPVTGRTTVCRLRRRHRWCGPHPAHTQEGDCHRPNDRVRVVVPTLTCPSSVAPPCVPISGSTERSRVCNVALSDDVELDPIEEGFVANRAGVCGSMAK